MVVNLVSPIPYPRLHRIVDAVEHSIQLEFHPCGLFLHVHRHEVNTCMRYCLVHSLLAEAHPLGHVAREEIRKLLY